MVLYNGSHVHPCRKNLSADQWNRWRNPFNKKTADECFLHDEEKISFAKLKGYDVIQVWDYEADKMLPILVNLISEKLYEFDSNAKRTFNSSNTESVSV